MANLPVLEFSPIYKETVWGGRKLQGRLGKDLPSEGIFGESWEIVDLPSDQSETVAGELSGKTLVQLCQEDKLDLLGGATLLEGRFPLLFKFIDAQQTLSVQVHPDEAACTKLGDGARPKTEAWYIIDCDPGSLLYVGLKPGVNKEMFGKAVGDGSVEGLLHSLEVKPGDFIYLPSGTVHAIGEGILLAEVQQSSKTTYRVFDWNRMGLDGKPRQLHVEQALESIHFGSVGVPSFEPPKSRRPGILCSDFLMELITLEDGEETVLEGKGPLVTMGVDGNGSIEITAGSSKSEVRKGQTRLVPASLAGQVTIKSSGENTLLATRIPID